MAVPILIVDDDSMYASSLARNLKQEGFSPVTAATGERGLDLFAETDPVLVLVDLDLPGINGIEVIKRIKERDPNTICIVISGWASAENSTAAIRAGASEIIDKTASLPEIQFRVKKALDLAHLERWVQYLKDRETALQGIIGESPAMMKVKRRIEEVAAAPSSTVLIVGETGTGKELVARAVHRLSARRDQPLVPVNCAAIPENLLESEFFGYERGAFTGAQRTQAGLFETARGGSLFLDEVGELDLRLQAKLLRVIEERRVRRVGGTREVEVDVRLIAATNRELLNLVQEGRFREDLLYRLNVFQIDVPPLRDCGEDALLLARHFLQDFSRQLKKQVDVLDPAAEREIREHRFPGNVRQLRNLIEQAVILASGERLTVDLLRGLHPSSSSMLPMDITSIPVPAIGNAPLHEMMNALQDKERELENLEKEIIRRAVESAEGNKTKAAELLHMSRYALQRRIRRLEADA
jgi:DNA-binding NtrC family response regulator